MQECGYRQTRPNTQCEAGSMNHSTAPWGANSDDEDELDAREPWMWAGKRAFIFLIDATEPMFEKDINDSSHFEKCIKACTENLLKSVHRQDKDLFEIVLFGTSHVGQTAQPNHITTLLQSLDQCNADRIKDLLAILDDIDGFEKKHGHSNDYSLAEAFWHCLKIITNCTTTIYDKTIFLMTCNDNPHHSNPKLQNDTRLRVREIKNLDVDLKIIPFGLSFDMDLFYNEIYQITHNDPNDDNTEDTIIKSVIEVEDILEFVECPPKKRSTSRVLWSLGGDVQLGVAAYRFVKSTDPIPRKVKIERSKNAIVTSRVQAFNAETGEEVSSAQTSKAMNVGGETVTFRKEELKTLVEISHPGLILLGFKPMYTIKTWFHSKSPVFLYPEERLVKGSRTLFAALHEKCLAKKLVAICYFTMRRSGKPTLVALVPLAEKVEDKNTQYVPPGFVARFLPYADNIRDLKDQAVKCPHPDPELVSVAEQIVKKLKFKYQPKSFDNPRLQKLWAGIEALALGYDEPKETEDLTLPNNEVMDKRIDSLSDDFMSMAFPQGYNYNAVKKTSKDTDPSKPSAPKKAKIDLESMDMEEIAKKGFVEKLTADKLKQYLMTNGYKVSKMRKAELVEAVYSHLEVDQP
ncbi:X-ray repair cross-complementing protein 6 isoform X1 [Frankliniella occidentalis]|uniref:ATP-dependent DNA helicase 2 subunit 1 n=2 Tax=Frankliniella occidentalis TaxID=133901 RepID=A0A9C6WW45_FRAOC|nr:X-ray repair cross-complementing protein 6 isoform X1 [Frankliniella occidentalis]